MFCIKCGSETSRSDKLCVYCSGQKVEDPQTAEMTASVAAGAGFEFGDASAKPGAEGALAFQSERTGASGVRATHKDERFVRLNADGSLPDDPIFNGLPDDVRQRLKDAVAKLGTNGLSPADGVHVETRTLHLENATGEDLERLTQEAREALGRFQSVAPFAVRLTSIKTILWLAVGSAVVGGAMALFLFNRMM